MGYQEAEFKQNGAIVRLKFNNFMQYRDTEFYVGPNLNVIIGPNGSGKSTVVNGICIGLAGKCSVLGRATQLADYILVGKEKATIEIELHSNDGKNLLVKRTWNLAGKSEWMLNNKKCTEKEVKDRVSKLRIQVDNLCQFLPQDKVHDFSRLNNKGLLDSTVDAVGDMELKEKHQKLKELQAELDQGETTHERQIKLLSQKTIECEKLEDEVKAFKEKRLLLEKIEMLGKKRLWSVFQQSKRSCMKAKIAHEEIKKVVEDSEKVLNPLKLETSALKKKIDTLNRALLTHADAMKDGVNKAKAQSVRIESFQRELEDFKTQLAIIQRREKEKETAVEKCQQTIRSLEKQIEESGDSETLKPKLEQAKKNTKEATVKYEEEKEKLSNKKYELQGKQIEQQNIEAELRRLKSVEERKFEILKQLSRHASEAVQWLRKNRDSFHGEVYEPFVLSANVIKPENAIYIENSINRRDLSMFFFDDSRDMNKFLNQARVVMKLEQVGAAMVPSRSADQFVPRVPAEQLKKYGLVGYLKDMVEAPDSVLAYMCQQYNLQNTAVFHPSAEKYNDTICGQFGIQKYYFGNKQQIVTRSVYSGKTMTRTTEIKAHGTLSLSLDQEQINRVNKQLEENQRERNNIQMQMQSVQHNCQQLSEALEARRKEQREFEQIKNLVAKNLSLIENQRKRIREAMSKEEEENEKKKIAKDKVAVVGRMMQALNILKTNVESTFRARVQKDIKALQADNYQNGVDVKERKMADLRESMKESRQEMENRKKVLDELQEAMLKRLKEAKAVTGTSKAARDKPPTELVEYWGKESFPDGVEQIELLSGQLEAQASSAADIDQSVMEKYTELREQIQELDEAINSEKKSNESRSKKIDRLKEEWVGSLNKLVSQISDRFSRFFKTMGFVGRVDLTDGDGENDFDNYGIKILVKYRETEPLKELTPHLQSGGERSVATAVYMLALQALTTVPFRCVDEINQGMDARNERLIFELLVRASCHENSAQYFLLTPKLLSGLDYNPSMNVLIVHSGSGIPHHAEWDDTALTDRPKA